MAQVKRTLDKLFNNSCEFDNRTYHKIKTSELDSIDCLSEYKKDIRGYGLASNIKNKIASKNIDNFAVDDTDHEYIISMIEKDFDYKDYDELFESVYRDKLEAIKPNIFVSGGLDSTTQYELLKRKHIAFKPYCVRYRSQGITFNDYEIKNIPDDTIVIDFDIIDFFDSGKFLEVAQKYHCVTPQFLPLLKVFEDIDGPILETSSAPNVSMDIGNNNGLFIDRLHSKYLTYRHALDLRNDGSIFNFFRSHVYIDKLSTKYFTQLNKLYGRDVSRGSTFQDSTTSVMWQEEECNIKEYLYKNIFKCVGKKSVKFTGFEALKIWYADKYIGNDPYLQVFDKHFRKPLLKRNVDMFKDLPIINILKG